MLLAKTKVNTIDVLISKTLINSCINHDEVSSVNVLRECNEIKEEISNPQNAVEYTMSKRWKRIVSVVRKVLRTKIQVSK